MSAIVSMECRLILAIAITFAELLKIKIIIFMPNISKAYGSCAAGSGFSGLIISILAWTLNMINLFFLSVG
jgi:hypothetical protein